MLTPARQLRRYISTGCILPLRDMDGKLVRNVEWQEITCMIDAGTVEGIGSQKAIRFLRMTEPTPANMRQDEQAQCEHSTPGSIITQASKTVVREHLEDGHYVWQHIACRGL